MFIKKQNSKTYINWPIITGIITMMGLLNFSIIATNAIAGGGEIPYIHFLYEMTGAYAALALFPALFWFFENYPIKKTNWIRLVLLHLFASIVYGLSHTFLMWLSREIFFQILGYGHYNYGHIGYRILMEYQKQFLVYWFVFGIYFLIGYVQENQERKLKTVRLEQQLTKYRLQALQMQLNPHFLFNTLNMISSIMYENVKVADKMIASLSDLLRYTLKSKNIENETLKDEIKKLNLYIEIMKARFSEKLTVHLEIDPVTLPALVPPFVLQPLVENSITHSIESVERSSVIRIISKKENNKLKIIVEDNGPGIPEDFDLSLSDGIGLSNTVERLEKLYGLDHTFKLQNNDKAGICAIMVIPFKTLEKPKGNINE